MGYSVTFFSNFGDQGPLSVVRCIEGLGSILFIPGCVRFRPRLCENSEFSGFRGCLTLAYTEIVGYRRSSEAKFLDPNFIRSFHTAWVVSGRLIESSAMTPHEFITGPPGSDCSLPQCRLKMRPCNGMGYLMTFFRLPRLCHAAKFFPYQTLTKPLFY